MKARGFTLLEVVVALAILAMALMAIFQMNSGAVANHVYTKHVTVATLLARSKMTDIEQELFDKGFQNDDDEMDGDFSDEGWPSYKWRAKIMAPKTDGVPPEQLISALFNIPMDEGGGLGALFGMGAEKMQKNGASGAGAGMAAMAAMGPLAGFANQQLTQMIQEITKTVREVHLTVSWKNGKDVDSIDIVTHVVSMGVGGDRNGGGTAGPGGTTGGPPGQMMNPRTGQIVSAPVQCRDNPGAWCDPADQTPLVPTGQATQWMNPRTNRVVPNPVPCRDNPQAMCDPSDPTLRLIPAPQQGTQQMNQGTFRNGQLNNPNPFLNRLPTFRGGETE